MTVNYQFHAPFAYPPCSAPVHQEFFATYCKLLSLVSSNDPALSGQTLAEYTFRERVGALINHLFQNSPSYMLQGLTAREHVRNP